LRGSKQKTEEAKWFRVSEAFAPAKILWLMNKSEEPVRKKKKSEEPKKEEHGSSSSVSLEEQR
jgi:hypothetical protein